MHLLRADPFFVFVERRRGITLWKSDPV